MAAKEENDAGSDPRPRDLHRLDHHHPHHHDHHVQWVDNIGISIIHNDNDIHNDNHNDNDNDNNGYGDGGDDYLHGINNDADTKRTTGTDEASSANRSSPRKSSPSPPPPGGSILRPSINGATPLGGGSGNTGGDHRGPLCSLFRGMRRDLKARLPLYPDDWKTPTSLCRVANAAVFAFVVQLIPALIFAELLDKTTEGSLGVAETLLSAGIIGVIYAVLSGQPLVLVGITGCVCVCVCVCVLYCVVLCIGVCIGVY